MPTAISQRAVFGGKRSTLPPEPSPSGCPRLRATRLNLSTLSLWRSDGGSTRALMMAAAEMYISGVSTRQVEKVMQEFGIESLSSTQVSRATKQLDKELEAWRNRPIGVMKYLILDARYEKARQDGVVRDAAVLTAIGIGEDERRHVLGVSVKLSEAEVHWRDFLQSLKDRGLVGTEFIVADDHAGLKAARRAVFGGIKWPNRKVCK